MKKYFLMFATFAAALTMMSCEKDKGNTGNGGNGGGGTNPPTDELKLNLDEAVYYGEKTADVGYYSMTFVVDGTSNKLRLDMFASVVDPVSTPKLTAGTYDLGTITEPTSKTYFVASNGSDTEGTLYWKEGTAVLVTGGSINVQSAAGGYTSPQATRPSKPSTAAPSLSTTRGRMPRELPLRPTPISPSTRESVCLPTSSSAK